MAREKITKLTITADGNVSMDYRQIRRIDIRDIVAIESYDISVEDGVLIHRVAFHNGTKFELAYNSDGTFRSLKGHQLGLIVSEGGELLTLGEGKANPVT